MNCCQRRLYPSLEEIHTSPLSRILFYNSISLILYRLHFKSILLVARILCWSYTNSLAIAFFMYSNLWGVAVHVRIIITIIDNLITSILSHRSKCTGFKWYPAECNLRKNTTNCILCSYPQFAMAPFIARRF